MNVIWVTRCLAVPVMVFFMAFDDGRWLTMVFYLLGAITSSLNSMDDDDLYESLPTHSVLVHMVAGAAAGIGEHCLMYPIDSVKTRMQSLCDKCPERHSRTPVGGLWSWIRREGIFRPIRGVSAVAVGAVPAHAFYFTIYERMKLLLTGGHAGHHPLAHGLSGVCATLVHDAVMNPAEVVKQRMQMFGSPYSGCLECVRCVYRAEGVQAFYRSYTTQLVMNVPFQASHFIVYEFFQQTLNPRHTYDPTSHMVSGALAGGIAAAVTTPLDVCKTVLNTQELAYASVSEPCSRHQHMPNPVQSLRHAASTILKHRGFTGFFSGLQARVLFQMPATAIAWSVYEFFKYGLGLWESPSTGPSPPVVNDASSTNNAERSTHLFRNDSQSVSR